VGNRQDFAPFTRPDVVGFFEMPCLLLCIIIPGVETRRRTLINRDSCLLHRLVPPGQTVGQSRYYSRLLRQAFASAVLLSSAACSSSYFFFRLTIGLVDPGVCQPPLLLLLIPCAWTLMQASGSPLVRLICKGELAAFCMSSCYGLHCYRSRMLLSILSKVCFLFSLV
jgi:hypothetical protein